MRETPRSQETANGAESAHPQQRPGRALAHPTGASGSETPHRSDGRTPQTPRGVRHTDHGGRLGTLPPVPRRPALFVPFTVPALLAPVLWAALFALLTWQVAAGGPLRRLDERACRVVCRPHGPSPVAEFLSNLGSPQVALPVLGAVLVWAGWRGLRDGVPRWWLPPLAAATAMAAVPAIVVPLKEWIARPGPLGPVDGYGWYPSGHTATATVAYGSAALLLASSHHRLLDRRLLAAAAVLLNLAVGAGLVRRGYHWPLDVLGSWFLCPLLLWGVARARRLTGHRADLPPPCASRDEVSPHR